MAEDGEDQPLAVGRNSHIGAGNLSGFEFDRAPVIAGLRESRLSREDRSQDREGDESRTARGGRTSRASEAMGCL